MGKFAARGCSVGAKYQQVCRFHAYTCMKDWKDKILTDVEVLADIAVLDVAEKDEARLVLVLSRDVGSVPGDDLGRAGLPHGARGRSGDVRAEYDIDVARARFEHLGGGSGDRSGGSSKDGEDGSELGGGEHVCSWYRGR